MDSADEDEDEEGVLGEDVLDSEDEDFVVGEDDESDADEEGDAEASDDHEDDAEASDDEDAAGMAPQAAGKRPAMPAAGVPLTKAQQRAVALQADAEGDEDEEESDEEDEKEDGEVVTPGRPNGKAARASGGGATTTNAAHSASATAAAPSNKVRAPAALVVQASAMVPYYHTLPLMHGTPAFHAHNRSTVWVRVPALLLRARLIC